MPTFGRKPADADIGVGAIGANIVRGSIAGRVSANGWLYLFGARVGKQTAGGGATYAQALYRASAGTITTKDGESGNIAATAVMDWAGAGVNQTVKPTAPIMVSKNIDYALLIRCVSGALAHGMDHSGTVLHDRATGSFPSPLAATDVRPEGRISAWCEIQNNRAPKTPSNLTPKAGAIVTTSPTLGADFRDDDEVLPGFALGTADKIKQYTFEVWNAAKTTRLQTSGLANATGPQQTARRVTWTPTTLASGSYVARCTVYDQFGTPSPQAEWSFTISSGGAVGPEIAPAHIAGVQGLYDLTNKSGATGNGLTLNATWSHSGSLAATSSKHRIKAGGGTVVRAEITVAVSVASGGSTSFTFTNGSGDFSSWAVLTAGQRYTWETQFQDSAGAWSQWVSTAPFVINGAPGVPTSLLPAPKAYSEYILLSAVIGDPNDAAETLMGEFMVRPAGVGSGVLVPVARRSFSNGRHYAQLAAAELPSYQAYEWQVRGVDPWGLAGSYTTWQSFTYAAPPVITFTSPGSGAVLNHGTPTIAFTVSMAMLRYRIRIFDNVSGALAYEYGLDTGATSGSHTVAAGVLRNLKTYKIEVEVTSSSGLIGRATRLFSISYSNPAAVSEITVVRTPGPFEPAQPSSSWSQIDISWTEPSLSDAPALEFQGYVLRIKAISTGVETIAALIGSRSERAFTFRVPTSGETYDFSVTYLVERNQVDTVESLPRTGTGGVALMDTVIVTLDDDGLGAPLRFWESREVDWITEIEIVPSWTEHPIGFQGAANSNVISGTFLVKDDELGSYKAGDIVAAVRQMAGPRIDDEGRLRPRVIAYRDPRGRNLIVMLSKGKESDKHIMALGQMALTFTQIGVEIGALVGGSGLVVTP